MDHKSLLALKVRGTLKCFACLPDAIPDQSISMSFYWRRCSHPMPNLDRLVLIFTVVKLMHSRRTNLLGLAFRCVPNSMNSKILRTESNSKRRVKNFSTTLFRRERERRSGREVAIFSQKTLIQGYQHTPGRGSISVLEVRLPVRRTDIQTSLKIRVTMMKSGLES